MSVSEFQIRPAIESECAVLGGLLLKCEFFKEISKQLCPNDFHAARHRKIFAAMKDLYDKYETFDVPMLLDLLHYEDSADMGRLYELVNNCASTANIKAHADIVREKSVQRQLLACAVEIQDDATEVLASYFEELAAEIRTEKVCPAYLEFIIVQVNKALIDSLNHFDELRGEEESNE